MELKSIYVLLVLSMCTVLSGVQNSKLMDRLNKLEMTIFDENLCQNCTMEERIRYLELILKKLSIVNSADQSVNWSNNFAFALASAIMSFGFNLTVAVLRICYTNRVNRKFKRWEESEEQKFFRKLERMQFPPTADY